MTVHLVLFIAADNYLFVVLRPPAWLSWSYHLARKCTPPSARPHSWLEGGGPSAADTDPTVAGADQTTDHKMQILETMFLCKLLQWLLECVPYLRQNIRPDHAPHSWTGHPIMRPQGQRPLCDVSWDRVDYPGLHRTSVGTGERLVEAHHRRARRRHDLVVGVVIGDGGLRRRQDGVGQVGTAGAGVGLLPAQLTSVVHRMLSRKQSCGNGINLLVCDQKLSDSLFNFKDQELYWLQAGRVSVTFRVKSSSNNIEQWWTNCLIGGAKLSSQMW